MGDLLVTKLKTERGGAAICRLCATLRKADCFVHIRDPNLNMLMKLERCCQLSLSANDHLPENVCLDCVEALDKCWTFAEKVREAQESLQALYAVEEVEVIQADIQDDSNKDCPSDEDISKTFIEMLESAESNKRELSRTNSPNTPPSVESKSEECTIYIETGLADQEIEEESVNDDALQHVYKESEVIEEDGNEFLDTVSSNQVYNTETIDVWRDYPWICTACGDVFSGVVELREHVGRVHSTNECVYVCADCSKTYLKYYLFFNHVIAHRRHLNGYCDLCSDFCETPEVLAKHRNEHKNLDGMALCSICAKAFKSTISLHSHLRIHKEEQLYQCDVCDKKFVTKPNLKAHQRIHFGVKEFVCHQCGKGFVQKTNLEEHLVTHVEDKPYACNECDKTFKTHERLAKHKNVHSSVRPHKCEQCGKEFREKDTLRIHMRIHTGVRPYECEFCGKRFRFRSILVTHRHQHTGVRPYSCQECDHHFTNWPNYNKHMKRRHGVKGGRKADQPTIQTLATDSKSTTSSTTIISIHSYSAPELDTSTTELEKFLGVHSVKEDGDGANEAGNSLVVDKRTGRGRGAARHKNPSSSTASTSLVKLENY